jgi:molecular chaperone DnaJ
MTKRDYYEILGVNKSADQGELKKVYRKLAMQYHPDKNPDDKGSEKKFKEINEAYEILKDKDKRAAYDRMGHAAFEGGSGRPGGPGAGFAGFDFARGGFTDIFDEMFGESTGGNQARTANQRGSDLRFNLDISLEEAFNGAQQIIRVIGSIACEECRGTGAAKGTKPETCSDCHGRGKMRMQQGFFTVERSCPSCQGIGQTIKDPCFSCNETGRRNQEQSLNVSIPAGIEDGTRIRLPGEGGAGLRGVPPGDLYVFVTIKEHKLFERDGADLHAYLPIPMTTAALGGSIEFPTIDEKKAKIKIPEGSQTGQKFRLANKGMSILRRSGRGDMYVHITIETPKKLTKKQKELLEKFAEERNASSDKPDSEGFLDNVKNLWSAL